VATNDPDIPALEVLEESLAEFSGHTALADACRALEVA
jgi:hypothetical protein